MNDVERLRFPPPDDEAMLPWYQGAFSHGFIALHPFFTVEGLDPQSCQRKTLVLERSDCPEGVDIIEWMDEQSSLYRQGKELSSGPMTDISKNFGRCIGWREICQEVGMPDHCIIDRALRTSIGGLKPEHEDAFAAERLIRHCNRHKIFIPDEGVFQPTMESRLVSAFQKAGFSEIIVGDEFGDNEKTYSLSVLAEPIAWESRNDWLSWGARRLIAPDQSLLAWVHWDSFYTAIFGTAERLADLRLSDSFEGFWCSEKSTTYWLLEEPIPIVQ